MVTVKKLFFGAVVAVIMPLLNSCFPPQPEGKELALPEPTSQAENNAPVAAKALQNLEQQLYEQLQTLVGRNQGARSDGYVYAVDLSQIILYAAFNQDRRLYTPLRDFAVRHLIVDNAADPYTRGFVLWRYREGTPPDASGTTEALRLAQGLWIGSQVFGDERDRDRATMILHGYARHAHTDAGVWLVRNYFNLNTRAFATNSFLLGYDPDFLNQVAQATGESEFQSVAEQSSALVQQAVTPTGLLHDIVQPEVRTLVPELANLAIFSPNDVVKLANACNVAERATVAAPEVGQKIVGFAVNRLSKLNTYYYGRTGEPAIDQAASAPTYACLVRLAVKLNQQKALNAFLPGFITHTEFVAQNPQDSTLYTVTEVLLALQAILTKD